MKVVVQCHFSRPSFVYWGGICDCDGGSLGLERLIEIGNQIVDILEPDRQPE